MKREYLWVPEGEVLKGTNRKLCAPIPFKRDNKPIRVWSLPHYLDKGKVPPPLLPLVHRESAILETISHDWAIRLDHLYYRGQYSEGGVWLAIEFEE